MLVSRLTDLPPALERAVIINVHTTRPATLALLSTLRYGQMPALLVDCEPTEASRQWFTALMERIPFDVIHAPIRKHGEMLDTLFYEIPCEQLLLVDSDVEVLNPLLLDRMRAAMRSDERVFGSGYLHPAQWLTHHWDTSFPIPAGIGYYIARPWIPFTLLRFAHVRSALRAGLSFMHKLRHNDVPQSRLLSKLLWQRFRYARLRSLRLGVLDPFRATFDGYKPAYVHFDTGAEIHHFLESKGLRFAAVSSAEEVPWTVRHLGGATRTGLHGEGHDSVRTEDADSYAERRLRSEYNISLNEGN